MGAEGWAVIAVQAALSIVLLVGALYLLASGVAVPDWMTNLLMLVVGSWFAVGSVLSGTKPLLYTLMALAAGAGGKIGWSMAGSDPGARQREAYQEASRRRRMSRQSHRGVPLYRASEPRWVSRGTSALGRGGVAPQTGLPPETASLTDRRLGR